MNSKRVKRILVSQPEPMAGRSPYFDIAEKYDVDIVFYPFIKVVGVSIKEFRSQKINILDFSAILFTTRTAIDHFFRICNELKISIPDSMKYFCKSETIALYLQKYIQYRKRKIFFSSTGRLEDLRKDLQKYPKEKYLLPVAEDHSDDVAELLADCKLNFEKSVMYRTVSNDFEKDEKLDYDMILFFSPLGIQSLLKNFPNYKQGDTAFGSFGENTAKTVINEGLRLDLRAPSPEFPSMTAALDNFLQENHKLFP